MLSGESVNKAIDVIGLREDAAHDHVGIGTIVSTAPRTVGVIIEPILRYNVDFRVERT
jgi:hypothetical protein